MSKEQDRGPAARKVELERRLDSNTEAAEKGLRNKAGHGQGTSGEEKYAEPRRNPGEGDKKR